MQYRNERWLIQRGRCPRWFLFPLRAIELGSLPFTPRLINRAGPSNVNWFPPPIQLADGYWILGLNAAVTPAREEMNSFDISCCRSTNLKQEVMERQKACQSLCVHGSSVHARDIITSVSAGLQVQQGMTINKWGIGFNMFPCCQIWTGTSQMCFRACSNTLCQPLPTELHGVSLMGRGAS